MSNSALPAPKLLRRFVKYSSGSNRSYGIFECNNCCSEFEGRMERLNVMKGLCNSCANIHAGRSRATYEKGVIQSRLHVTWANMKRRCISPVGKEKIIYAGVNICAEWMEFGPFMEWAMKNGYTDKMTIDRKICSLGYSPDNCRFVDYSTQNANRGLTSRNSSGYAGVSFQSGAWRASISWQHKVINIGRFKKIEDAVNARNKYIIESGLPHTLSEIKNVKH